MSSNTYLFLYADAVETYTGKLTTEVVAAYDDNIVDIFTIKDGTFVRVILTVDNSSNVTLDYQELAEAEWP